MDYYNNYIRLKRSVVAFQSACKTAVEDIENEDYEDARATLKTVLLVFGEESE